MTASTTRLNIVIREMYQLSAAGVVSTVYAASCSHCNWSYADVQRTDVEYNARWHRSDHTKMAVA